MYSEYFKNEYPFEKLVQVISEREIEQLVKDCDYTVESNIIANINFPSSKVNLADAVVFYQMGFDACKQQVYSKLKPIEL